MCRQFVEHRCELEDEHVNMIVFNRHIAPPARAETDIAEHLAGSKRHIPHIIPRQAEIGRFAAQIHVMLPFFTLGHISEIMHRG